MTVFAASGMAAPWQQSRSSASVHKRSCLKRHEVDVSRLSAHGQHQPFTLRSNGGRIPFAVLRSEGRLGSKQQTASSPIRLCGKAWFEVGAHVPKAASSARRRRNVL